jgi:starvation-inducible DNA-binding protein
MEEKARHSQPWLHQRSAEIQQFGTVRQFPLALSQDARAYSSQRLNAILADSRILHALYKKHHWLMRGPTFYQLHLLLDKHATEQLALIDTIAERIQTLGGVAVGDPRHVAEITRIPRPPNGCEESSWRTVTTPPNEWRRSATTVATIFSSRMSCAPMSCRRGLS